MAKSPYKLIAIGASAGGLEAVSQILAALPADFPLPIAVAQHNNSSQASRLPAILNSLTPLEVKEVDDKDEFIPQTVFVAPAGYHLSIEEAHYFSLSVEGDLSFSCPSIDVLFASGAQALGPAFIAILLTGANRDGAQGVKAVKDGGGVTYVQSPESSEFQLMPRSALELSAPNFIGTPQEIAQQLLKITSSYNDG